MRVSSPCCVQVEECVCNRHNLAVSTSDMNNITFHLCVMGYRIIHMTSQRTGENETKANPTIRICQLTALTGDCLSWNACKGYA